MSPDSVILEMAILDLSPSNEQQARDLWSQVDEQHLAPELVRQLAQQGLRCGIVGAHLPDWIRDSLNEQNRCLKLDRSSGTATPNQTTMQRRLQCRAQSERCVPISGTFPQITIRDEPDQTHEYSEGRCYLIIAATPLGDGRVDIELVPEVHHGAPRLRWVGQNGHFRAELAQRETRFDALKVKVTLTAGQTLVFAGRNEPERIGSAVCQADTSHEPSGRLVLLRLAQTQFDDLFAPHNRLTPIATLAE
jgi:hypothetical protein